MKYFITSFLFLFLFILYASGQVKIFPRGGLAISTTTWEQVEFETLYRTGATFGLGTEFGLVSKFKLQVEFNFVSKGYKDRDDDPGKDPSYIISNDDYEHRYLVLPVLVKRYFGRKSVRPYADVGPYIGWGLGGTYSARRELIDNGVLVETAHFSQRITYGDPTATHSGVIYYVKRFEFGLTGGGGILLYERVAHDMRYEYGITSPFGKGSNFKNRSYQVAVIVPISLGKKGTL